MNFIGEPRMRPETQSKRMLGATRSKAKMYEYAVPEQYHITIPYDPAKLFPLTIGLLGEYAAKLSQNKHNETELNELKSNLRFSAHFFDSYLESKLNRGLDPYLILLGSSAYYLCDLPGSSKVLADRLGETCPDLKTEELENLLLYLLQGNWNTYYDGSGGIYGKHIDAISQRLSMYHRSGIGKNRLLRGTVSLRKIAYDNGSARQLLFADVISAVVKKRVENSTWSCLPDYTGLPIEQWREALLKRTFIHELWPAQHLLGTHGVFRGNSAVVQMPTSAGKTKAIEIILRSAFSSERTSFAITVAPFRALCNEIKNSLIDAFQGEDINVDELPDVLQQDYYEFDFFSEIFPSCQVDTPRMSKQVLVVTPEKLIYMLRQSPELAENIGLIIYDEGHQFDSGKRGIRYELLLTSLKSMIPKHTQTILISAVISNARDVGKWLNGETGEVVTGTDLIPTYRTVAFASWLDILGRLEFIEREDSGNGFFVPRVIEQHRLRLRPRERKEHFFPEKNDGKMVALYLGLKLVPNGSVAIFCGTKATASSLCEIVIDAYDRGLPIAKPIEASNQEEVRRLHHLHECNLGAESIAAKSADIGIYTHHANMPQGIRLAVEHAMKEGLARFVICTSTLAQGVNLPIRYLLFTSVYQGRERIKVRDFHNLIGRAGRSGMHTEGSIVFADPDVYDQKNAQTGRWKWRQIQELLDPGTAEPCASILLSIFKPLESDDQKFSLIMEPLELARRYCNGPTDLEGYISQVVEQLSDKSFTQEGLRAQVTKKLDIIESVESYLLSHWDDDGSLQEEDVKLLARGTLAYFLADEDQKGNILELFVLLAHNIAENIPDIAKRKAYGATLYGVADAISIENWVSEHIQNIITCADSDELLTILWPIMCQKISNKSFLKCDHPEVLIDIAKGWINGQPFYELFDIIDQASAKIIWGTKRRNYKVGHIVDICENALAYEGTLVLGAVSEMLNLILTDNNGALIEKIGELQKQLRYGLFDPKAITLCEMGFSDRVIAMELCSILDKDTKPYRQVLISSLRKKDEVVREILSKYPLYFTERLDALL